MPPWKVYSCSPSLLSSAAISFHDGRFSSHPQGVPFAGLTAVHPCRVVVVFHPKAADVMSKTLTSLTRDLCTPL